MFSKDDYCFKFKANFFASEKTKFEFPNFLIKFDLDNVSKQKRFLKNRYSSYGLGSYYQENTGSLKRTEQMLIQNQNQRNRFDGHRTPMIGGRSSEAFLELPNYESQIDRIICIKLSKLIGFQIRPSLKKLQLTLRVWMSPFKIGRTSITQRVLAIQMIWIK